MSMLWVQRTSAESTLGTEGNMTIHFGGFRGLGLQSFVVLGSTIEASILYNLLQNLARVIETPALAEAATVPNLVALQISRNSLLLVEKSGATRRKLLKPLKPSKAPQSLLNFYIHHRPFRAL